MTTKKKVFGIDLDDNTRCKHYHTKEDIIAIKFKCCDTYYACYECHQELANHPAQVWEIRDFNQKAILCGSCKKEISVASYKNSNFTCPNCHAKFNQGCQYHYHLYFET